MYNLRPEIVHPGEDGNPRQPLEAIRQAPRNDIPLMPVVVNVANQPENPPNRVRNRFNPFVDALPAVEDLPMHNLRIE